MALDPQAAASAELEGSAESGAAEGGNDAASASPVGLDEGAWSLEAERQRPPLLERVLERVEMPAAALRRVSTQTASIAVAAPIAPASPTAPTAPTLGIARVMVLQGRSASVVWRTGGQPLTARLADEVESELIARVVEEKGLVLVEQGSELTVVGVIQTGGRAFERSAPDEISLRGRTVRLESEGSLSLKAETIEIEGGSEVLLRVGPVALRLRRDGSIELVGNNVYLTSRGVFRLIGSVLRLN